ncbi:MAG TPA: hypothetical protein VGP48_10590 [Stellaceae bacterium]|nr:hypothetical protein [Stellaceae bacterium]
MFKRTEGRIRRCPIIAARDRPYVLPGFGEVMSAANRPRQSQWTPEEQMNKGVFARIGAVVYVLWGLLHYTATYNVYQLGLGASSAVVQGRLFQAAFYLFCFATTAIVLAIRMNWHNSRAGFWLNAAIVGVADIPFILFEIVPGHVPFWPGILGPALWVVAMIFTGLGQMRPAPVMPVGIRRGA